MNQKRDTIESNQRPNKGYGINRHNSISEKEEMLRTI
jgi:hypothetical protein